MRALLAWFLVFVSIAAAQATDWKLIKYNGRDHLTIDNIAQFYRFGRVITRGKVFAMTDGSRSLRGSRGSNEIFINRIKFILSYPVREYGGEILVSRMDLVKLIEPVMRPRRIKNAGPVETVILDPGHGGHDPGARGHWGNEATYTLDVARRTRDLLLQEGFKVHLTRDRDVFIPLDDRPRFGNKFSNAIFISIHFNHGKSDASGLETFTLAPRGVPSMASDGPRMSDLNVCPGNVNDAANMALATATHAAMISTVGGYDRGIKRARFRVIRQSTIPAVLVECGFLSSSRDGRKIASNDYRQLIAMALTRAVNNFRDAVEPVPEPEPSVGPLVDLKTKEAAASPESESITNAPE